MIVSRMCQRYFIMDYFLRNRKWSNDRKHTRENDRRLLGATRSWGKPGRQTIIILSHFPASPDYLNWPNIPPTPFLLLILIHGQLNYHEILFFLPNSVFDPDPDPHHLAGSGYGIRIVVQENLKSTILTFWNMSFNFFLEYNLS